jgi:hypothetical protein
VLWPPNNQMVPITINAKVVDLIDQAPTARIVSVSSNEPPDPLPDWAITGPLSVSLRATRNPRGTGRIYTITIEARDAAGNTTTGTVQVTVPHDLR